MTKSPFSQNREAADILSARNRYTAQHFKAETKRHKWKTRVNKKKRQKCFLKNYSIRLFLNCTTEQVVNAHLPNIYQKNLIFLTEIFKAEMKTRLEPYGSTPCRHITVVVLGVCDSVVHQCRVSATVGGRMIHSSINNSSGGQACICCQEQGSRCHCVCSYIAALFHLEQ